MSAITLMCALLPAFAQAASTPGPKRSSWDEKKEVDVVCPVDGFKFRATEITGTNEWGGIDADYCKHAIKTTPIEYRVWTCPSCFYSGLRTEKRNDFDPKNAPTKDVVLGRLKPMEKIDKAAKQSQIPVHVKFDLLAQVVALKGEPPDQVANALLWGSWAVRQKGAVYLSDFDEWEEIRTKYGLNKPPLELGKDKNGKDKNRTDHELGQIERMAKDVKTFKGITALLTRYTAAYALRLHGENVDALAWIEELRKSKGEISIVDDAVELMAKSIELERSFQKRAAEQFQKAVESGKLEARAVSQIQYLLGELHRRMGDAKLASEWFDKAIAGADKDLKALAEKQKALVK
jgi:uncharacterized protein (DUF2225 family)